MGRQNLLDCQEDNDAGRGNGVHRWYPHRPGALPELLFGASNGAHSAARAFREGVGRCDGNAGGGLPISGASAVRPGPACAARRADPYGPASSSWRRPHCWNTRRRLLVSDHSDYSAHSQAPQFPTEQSSFSALRTDHAAGASDFATWTTDLAAWTTNSARTADSTDRTADSADRTADTSDRTADTSD